MFVYLSLSDLSGVRNQDGGEPLLTGGRSSSEVASVQRKAPQNRSCLPPGLVSEGQWSWAQGLTGPCVALVPPLMALQLDQPLLPPP